MIAALWSNSNYDDDKGTRTSAIEEIESNFQEVVDILTGNTPPEEDIDESNPFFGQMKKGMKKLEEPLDREGTVKEVVDYSRYIDQ